MATSTKKDLNSARRGMYIDQADNTTAKQVVVVSGGTATGSSSVSTSKSVDDAVRGSLLNESDGTVSKQVLFIS